MDLTGDVVSVRFLNRVMMSVNNRSGGPETGPRVHMVISSESDEEFESFNHCMEISCDNFSPGSLLGPNPSQLFLEHDRTCLGSDTMVT